jgi:3-isopropylmalate/(R)-2-methylmalate dehydratase small subunit
MRGRAFKFGDDTDTDVIIPARYLNTTDAKELAAHCMEGVRPGFAKEASPGDIIVAGKNFGCGSSREHAPIAIRGAGISCVIAKSFARIFFRNSFNMGLTLLQSAEASERIEEGDQLGIDPSSGIIRNETKKEEYRAGLIPEFMRNLVKAGGLIPYVLKLRSQQGGDAADAASSR